MALKNWSNSFKVVKSNPSMEVIYILFEKARLSQDRVESFFSLQRQSCDGKSNMTAYTYGYNVNSAKI